MLKEDADTPLCYVQSYCKYIRNLNEKQSAEFVGRNLLIRLRASAEMSNGLKLVELFPDLFIG